MSYSVESINGDGNISKTKQAQQEQILQMQQLREGKTQESGTKVEDPTALTATESKTDTIEISAEGQKALEQMRAAKAVEQPVVKEVADNSTDVASSAKTTESSTAAVVNQLTSEDSVDVSSTDLYTMTESELRTLVSKGTITRTEMNDELERRSVSD